MTDSPPMPVVDLEALGAPAVPSDRVYQEVRLQQAERLRRQSETNAPVDGLYTSIDDIYLAFEDLDSDPVVLQQQQEHTTPAADVEPHHDQEQQQQKKNNPATSTHHDEANKDKDNDDDDDMSMHIRDENDGIQEEKNSDDDMSMSISDSDKSFRPSSDGAASDDDDDDDEPLLSFKASRSNNISQKPSFRLSPSDHKDDQMLSSSLLQKKPSTSRRTNKRKKKTHFSSRQPFEPPVRKKTKTLGVASFPDSINHNSNHQDMELIVDSDDDSHLDTEEAKQLKRLGDKILDAEESLKMDQLYGTIVKAEERYRMGALGTTIAHAEETWRTPGGRVQYVQGTHAERTWEFHDQLRDFESTVRILQRVQQQRHRQNIWDVDNMGNQQVRVTKELPKFLGDTDQLVWDQRTLKSTILDRLGQDGPIGDLEINVLDKEGDPHTVVLELVGDEPVLDRVAKLVTLMYRAKQMQYLTLHSKTTMANRKRQQLATRLHSKTTMNNEERQQLATRLNKEAYDKFRTKMKDVREIEFWFSKGIIHGQAIAGSMWKVHKKYYGETCTPQCECVAHLDRLVSTVIEDHLKKKRMTDPKYQRPKEFGKSGVSVVKFATNFATKFYPLLTSEFPKENNEMLLKRLVRMWKEHLKQKQFGIKCKDNCPCGEGWVMVFRKGRLDEKPATAPTNSKTVGSSAAPGAVRAAVPGHIPRRQPETMHSAVASLIPHAFTQKQYEVEFDTNQQLGFFVVTKKRFQDATVCKIFSVNKLVKEREHRLCTETIIVCAAVGGSSVWESVSSHSELKRMYKAAKQNGRSIRIRFVNDDVKDAKTVGRFWNSDFEWTGDVEGWAGGAQLAGKKIATARRPSPKTIELVAKKPRFESKEVEKIVVRALQGMAKPIEASSERVGGGHSGDDLSADSYDNQDDDESPPSVAQWHRSDPASARALQPKSILRIPSLAEKDKKRQEESSHLSAFRTLAGAPKRSKRMIRWQTKFEARQYDPQEKQVTIGKTILSEKQGTVQRPLEPESVGSTAAERTHDTSLENELLRAIKYKTCSDVMEVLLKGAETILDVPDNELPLKVARGYRDSFANEFERNNASETKSKLKTANMKLTLLKIFDQAIGLMRRCRIVRKWRKIEFTVDRIEGLRLTEEAKMSSSDKVTCQLIVHGEICDQMNPPLDIAEVVEWTSGKRFYGFYHGSGLSEKQRSRRSLINQFTILKLSADQDKMVLGEQSFSQDDVANASGVKGRIGVFRQEIKASTYLRKPVSVVCSVRKSAVGTRNRFESVRNEIRREFATFFVNIKRFNDDQERHDFGLQELDINFRFGNIITPLHAAVYLNDVHIVTELLNLGADMNAKHKGLSTPRELALDLSEREWTVSTYDDSGDAEAAKSVMEWQERETAESRQILKVFGFEMDKLSPYRREQEIVDEADDDDSLIANDKSSDVRGNSRDTLSPGNSTSEPTGLSESWGNSYAPTVGAASVGFDSTNPSLLNQASETNHNPDIMASVESSINQTSKPLETYGASLLPELSIEDLMGKKKCSHYGRPTGCIYGKRCHFLHLETIDPQEVQIESPPQYVPTNVVIKNEALGLYGARCYTALYHDRSRNVYLEAKGGKTIGQNISGVYWYETEQDARSALESMIFFHQSNQEPKIPTGPDPNTKSRRFQPAVLPRTSGTHFGRQNYPAKSSNSSLADNPIQRTESGEMKAFRRLCSANLSNNFSVIVTSDRLLRTDWEITRTDHGISASFKKSIPGHPPETFCSGCHGDVTYCQGRWYHESERDAKASAFLEFLKYCKKVGVLNSLEERIDNITLPYADK